MTEYNPPPVGAESSPAAPVGQRAGMESAGGRGLGGKLDVFCDAAESSPPAFGHGAPNWRDRINYAQRRSRVAQLRRRHLPAEPQD